MRCERVDDLLPAYLDGDLPGRLNERVSEHLDVCERCRCEFAAQQRALRTLDAGRHPVSIDLWADFSRRLQAQRPPAPSPWRLLRQPGFAGVMAAAAVALIAFAGPVSHPPVATDIRTPFALLPVSPREIARPIQEARLPPDLPGAVAAVPQAPPARTASPHTTPLHRAARRSWRLLRPTGAVPEHHSGRRWSKRRDLHAGHGSSGHRTLILASRPELEADLRSPGRNRNAQTLSADRPSTEAVVARYDSPLPAAQPSASAPSSRQARTGDPLKIASALFSVGEHAGGDVMGRELLRMAQEVARVGGETGSGSHLGAVETPEIPASDPSSGLTHSSGG